MTASFLTQHCVGGPDAGAFSHKTEVVRIEHSVHPRVKQYGNSSEKQLARMLWSLTMGRPVAAWDKPLKISQSTLAEMTGTTRSRVSFFMNRFRKMGLIEYNGTVQALPALHKYLLDGHSLR
jgi:CRP/FNR family cyclic AMP-dependent transcriptional regulator